MFGSSFARVSGYFGGKAVQSFVFEIGGVETDQWEEGLDADEESQVQHPRRGVP